MIGALGEVHLCHDLVANLRPLSCYNSAVHSRYIHISTRVSFPSCYFFCGLVGSRAVRVLDTRLFDRAEDI